MKMDRVVFGRIANCPLNVFQPQGGCVTKPRVGPLFPDTLSKRLYPDARRPKRGACIWTRKSGATLGTTCPGINPNPNGVAACVRHVCAVRFSMPRSTDVVRRGGRQ